MIFCFSGTGNSRYAAETLAAKLGEKLLSIPEELAREKAPAYELEAGEAVGFVFPVYYFGLPTVVLDFLRRASFENLSGNYFWLLLTCGGRTGNAGRRFSELCAARGFDVKYQNAVHMPDNYVLAYDVPNGREIEAMLNEADIALDAAAADIATRAEGDCNRLAGALPGLLSGALYPFYLLGRKTKKFTADPDACVHCGVCADNCPVGAIRMGEDGLPVWEKDRCALCLQCLNRCPARCIQYGKSTEKRGRYYNPRVLRR